jgi:hypothetical protein
MYVQVLDYIQYIFDIGPFTTYEQWWGIGIHMRGSDPPTHVNDLRRKGGSADVFVLSGWIQKLQRTAGTSSGSLRAPESPQSFCCQGVLLAGFSSCFCRACRLADGDACGYACLLACLPSLALSGRVLLPAGRGVSRKTPSHHPPGAPL